QGTDLQTPEALSDFGEGEASEGERRDISPPVRRDRGRVWRRRPRTRGWHPWLFIATPSGFKQGQRLPVVSSEGAAFNSQGCEPLVRGHRRPPWHTTAGAPSGVTHRRTDVAPLAPNHHVPLETVGS